MEPMEESLAENMQRCITEFELTPPPLKKDNSDLYIILVAGGRSVLFCYQSRTSKVRVIQNYQKYSI